MTIKISQLANLTVVQANTIVPVVSNITGTLTTVQANVQQLQNYIIANGVSADITALYTNAATQSDLIIGINANLSQANLGMKGYVDNLSAVESIANVNMKNYVDGQITAANTGVTAANVGIIGYIGLANTSMKGYVDGQVTAANAGITAANIGMIGFVGLANVNMKGYVDGQITAANTAITTANIAMKGYVDNQTYSNVQVDTYLTSGFSGTITGNLSLDNGFAFANVYVPTLSNSSGSAGQITWDNNYIYICVDTNIWKRANISTW